MHKYAIGALFFLGIWFVLFACVRKSRKPMLWSSLALGHAGPISQYWHVRDYWSPIYIAKIQIGNWVFGLEDYLFAFAFAGICSGIFDLLARKSGQKELLQFDPMGFLGSILFGLACLLVMGVLIVFLKLNSLHAIVVAFLISAAIILARRPKLITPAVQAAFIAAVAMWIFYRGFFLQLFPRIVSEWWNVNALSGMTMGGVPIEEVIWAWTAALFAGPAIRYCMGRSIDTKLMKIVIQDPPEKYGDSPTLDSSEISNANQ
ncbi:MAG: hypothetical protein JSW70_07305 [Syntrophobacterales bacterium]|nr:MAG: hypothetical protein JSW70_07305 [Syntrophobacterales bacterium]